MNVIQPKIEDLQQLISFNKEVFPNYTEVEEYIKYRFIDNPFCRFPLDTIHSVIENNEMIAQMMTYPHKIVYNNTVSPIFWGIDYIVHPEHRGKKVGKDLANYFLGQDYYMAIGFSPKSLVIHRAMGGKIIGFMHYFVKPIHIGSVIKYAFHRLLKRKSPVLSSYKFPDMVSHKNTSFNRIYDVAELQFPSAYWNQGVAETYRNPDYLKWRYFYKPDRYFLYSMGGNNSNNPIYFVVRPEFWKGVNCLKIVDARYDIKDEYQLTQIIEVVKKLANQLNLYAILFSSSIKKDHSLLKKKGFFEYQKEVVVTTYPFKHEENETETTNHFMINFADSDLDFFNTRGAFIYGKNY